MLKSRFLSFVFFAFHLHFSTQTSAFSIATITLVAREGFEPSKPLGRQIYSLLRLTASLPRRYPPADAPGLTLVVLWFLLSGFALLVIRAAPASHRLCPGLVSVTRCRDGKHGAGEGI